MDSSRRLVFVRLRPPQRKKRDDACTHHALARCVGAIFPRQGGAGRRRAGGIWAHAAVPPAARPRSPVTRHSSPVTRHPSPVTRHPSTVYVYVYVYVYGGRWTVDE